MPRQARSVTSKTSASSFCAALVAVVGDDALVGVLHLDAARLQLNHRAANAIEQIERLKARDHDAESRTSRPAADTPSSPSRCTHDRQQESLHLVSGRCHDGFNRRRHQHMRNQQREILKPAPLGQMHAHGVGGRGGLKSHAEETPPACRDSSRRVPPHRAANTPPAHRRPALHLKQIAPRCPARAACRRRSRRSRPAARQWPAPCRSVRAGVTQTGQPGPWTISIPAGSIWSMPLRMMECVCPPQTSMIFHGRVVTCVNLPRHALGDLAIAKFGKVLHLRNFPTLRWESHRPVGSRSANHRFRMLASPATRFPDNSCGTLRRPRKLFFLAGQFFVEHAHLRESPQGSSGRFLRRFWRAQSQRGQWCSRRPRPRARSPGRHA